MSDNTKTKRAKYFKDNSARNTKRQAQRVAKKFGNNGKNPKSQRAIRRANGDLKPVNELASITQHPDGRFARKLDSVARAEIMAKAFSA